MVGIYMYQMHNFICMHDRVHSPLHVHVYIKSCSCGSFMMVNAFEQLWPLLMSRPMMIRGMVFLQCCVYDGMLLHHISVRI